MQENEGTKGKSPVLTNQFLEIFDNQIGKKERWKVEIRQQTDRGEFYGYCSKESGWAVRKGVGYGEQSGKMKRSDKSQPKRKKEGKEDN